MMRDIAFVHTLEAQVDVFEKLAKGHAPQLKTYHSVQPELLRRAQTEGMSDTLVQDIQHAMKAAAQHVTGPVICTCSSIGNAAEKAGKIFNFPSHRIDRPMADQAVTQSDDILIMAALQSTLQPTTDLLLNSADRLGKRPSIRQYTVEAAWRLFESGNILQYHACIAEAIEQTVEPGMLVVLAQASMAGASELCGVNNPILSSPKLGFLTYSQQYFPASTQ